MHASAVTGPWKRIGLPALGIALMAVCVFLCPPLAVPMAFLLPLLVCPAQVSLGLWVSLLLPLVPCTGLWIAGGDLLLGLLLMPCSYLCLALTSWARSRKAAFTWVAALLSGVLLLTQTLWWARAMALMGGDPFTSLADQAVATLSSLPNADSLLYRLVGAGFLALPGQFQGTLSALQLGNVLVLNPALQSELFKALHFQLVDLFRQGIPRLMAQTSLLIGLFTTLRTAKEIGKRNPNPIAVFFRSGDMEIKRNITPYPLFRALRLPGAYRSYLLVMAVTAVVLSLVGGEVPALASTLLISAFTTVYHLLGAAVLVFLICKKSPLRAPLAGVLAAALYVLFPTVLFLLGLMDQFMDLRTATFHHHKEV